MHTESLTLPHHAHPAVYAGTATLSPLDAVVRLSARALSGALDLVDYGLLLVGDDDQVLFANRVALAEMGEQHPLRITGHKLQVRRFDDVAALAKALSGALHGGVQSMLTLQREQRGDPLSLSVVPLRDAGEAPAAVLLFGKRALCEELSTDAFARTHDLTLAETRVLKLLCDDCRPAEVARELGVKLSTVRTQISSIRSKTGARDIGGLVQRVSRLPPLPHVMRRCSS